MPWIDGRNFSLASSRLLHNIRNPKTKLRSPIAHHDLFSSSLRALFCKGCACARHDLCPSSHGQYTHWCALEFTMTCVRAHICTVALSFFTSFCLVLLEEAAAVVVVVVVVFLQIGGAFVNCNSFEYELGQQEQEQEPNGSQDPYSRAICAKTANSQVIMPENALMWQSVTIVVFQGKNSSHALFERGGGPRIGGYRDIICRSCQQPGHMSRDCMGGPLMICHNCGGRGHLAFECPSGRRVLCKLCCAQNKYALDWTSAVGSAASPLRASFRDGASGRGGLGQGLSHIG
ncbi:hypothetical protein TEA_008690 [Camellia sinensis var. sinensis]|uniref:CCHC-type domain-containing protein n=1 Tax=Camellia sinensis var. sinensis TaxID=542762 RepID=A0A4S4E204_CAMSN|nr:hypothetical protein TEA_008690 [Camellia sinensis var. sinensis]